MNFGSIPNRLYRSFNDKIKLINTVLDGKKN